MKSRVKRLMFYLLLLFVGSFIVESDIIMGHRESLLLRGAIRWVEEPRERENEDV